MISSHHPISPPVHTLYFGIRNWIMTISIPASCRHPPTRLLSVLLSSRFTNKPQTSMIPSFGRKWVNCTSNNMPTTVLRDAPMNAARTNVGPQPSWQRLALSFLTQIRVIQALVKRPPIMPPIWPSEAGKNFRSISLTFSWPSARVGPIETQVVLCGTVKLSNRRTWHNASFSSWASILQKNVYSACITSRVKPTRLYLLLRVDRNFSAK